MKLSESLTQALATVPAGISTQLSTTFADFAKFADEAMERSNAIVVTDASHTDGMKLARESRLVLRKIRCDAETARKQAKADYLAGGRAVDAVANIIKEAIEPIEAVLLEKEQFVERKEAAAKAKRSDERAAELRAVGIVPDLYLTQIDLFDDAMWAAFVQGQKDAIAAAQKRAADELAAREAEAKRVLEQEAENKRLRDELAAAERARRLKELADLKEKQRLEAVAAAEAKRIRDEKEAQEREQARKLKEIQDAADAKIAAERAEAKRIADEAAAVAAKEAARIKSEADRLAADNARKLREEQMAADAERARAQKVIDDKRKAEAEEKARIESEAQRAAQAPDLEKLRVFIAEMRSVPLPKMSTASGRIRLSALAVNVEKAFDHALEGAE